MAKNFTVSIKLSCKEEPGPGWHYELKGSDGFNWMSGPFKTVLRAVSDASAQIKEHLSLKSW